MSTPFTSPDGQTWQTLLTEITTAYSERRQAIGQPPYVPEAGRNVQSAAWWAGIQGWLEDNCAEFLDYRNPLDDAGTGFRKFTLDTWRAAAELPANGFRRSTDGWHKGLRGHVAYGDAIGSWVFRDIQRGFSALRWIGQRMNLGAASVPAKEGKTQYDYDPVTPVPAVPYTAPFAEVVALWGGTVDDDVLVNGANPFAGQYRSLPPFDGRANGSHHIAERDYPLATLAAGEKIEFQILSNYPTYAGGEILLAHQFRFANV